MNKNTFSPVFLLLSFIVVLSACDNGTTISSDSEESLIEQAYNKKFDDTTIFLGYKMGMTPMQVKVHSDSLVNSGRIKKSGKNYYYTYNGLLTHQTYQTRLDFEYFNDELYDFTLHFTGKDGEGRDLYRSYSLLRSEVNAEFLFFQDILIENGYKRIIVDDEIKIIKGNVEVWSSSDYFCFVDMYRFHQENEQQENVAKMKLQEDFSL